MSSKTKKRSPKPSKIEDLPEVLPEPEDPIAGLTTTSFRVGAEEFIVLSFPLKTPALPEGLTEAEQEVMQKILEGKPNAEIAKERRTSVRTVANQVAALFRKLGVSSRAALVAKSPKG